MNGCLRCGSHHNWQYNFVVSDNNERGWLCQQCTASYTGSVSTLREVHVSTHNVDKPTGNTTAQPQTCSYGTNTSNVISSGFSVMPPNSKSQVAGSLSSRNVLVTQKPSRPLSITSLSTGTSSSYKIAPAAAAPKIPHGPVTYVFPESNSSSLNPGQFADVKTVKQFDLDKFTKPTSKASPSTQLKPDTDKISTTFAHLLVASSSPGDTSTGSSALASSTSSSAIFTKPISTSKPTTSFSFPGKPTTTPKFQVQTAYPAVSAKADSNSKDHSTGPPMEHILAMTKTMVKDKLYLVQNNDEAGWLVSLSSEAKQGTSATGVTQNLHIVPVSSNSSGLSTTKPCESAEMWNCSTKSSKSPDHVRSPDVVPCTQESQNPPPPTRTMLMPAQSMLLKDDYKTLSQLAALSSSSKSADKSCKAAADMVQMGNIRKNPCQPQDVKGISHMQPCAQAQGTNTKLKCQPAILSSASKFADKPCKAAADIIQMGNIGKNPCQSQDVKGISHMQPCSKAQGTNTKLKYASTSSIPSDPKGMMGILNVVPDRQVCWIPPQIPKHAPVMLPKMIRPDSKLVMDALASLASSDLSKSQGHPVTSASLASFDLSKSQGHPVASASLASFDLSKSQGHPVASASLASSDLSKSRGHPVASVYIASSDLFKSQGHPVASASLASFDLSKSRGHPVASVYIASSDLFKSQGHPVASASLASFDLSKSQVHPVASASLTSSDLSKSQGHPVTSASQASSDLSKSQGHPVASSDLSKSQGHPVTSASQASSDLSKSQGHPVASASQASSDLSKSQGHPVASASLASSDLSKSQGHPVASSDLSKSQGHPVASSDLSKSGIHPSASPNSSHLISHTGVIPENRNLWNAPVIVMPKAKDESGSLNHVSMELSDEQILPSSSQPLLPIASFQPFTFQSTRGISTSQEKHMEISRQSDKSTNQLNPSQTCPSTDMTEASRPVVPVMAVMNKNLNVTSIQEPKQPEDATYCTVQDADGKVWLMNLSEVPADQRQLLTEALAAKHQSPFPGGRSVKNKPRRRRSKVKSRQDSGEVKGSMSEVQPMEKNPEFSVQSNLDEIPASKKPRAPPKRRRRVKKPPNENYPAGSASLQVSEAQMPTNGSDVDTSSLNKPRLPAILKRRLPQKPPDVPALPEELPSPAKKHRKPTQIPREEEPSFSLERVKTLKNTSASKKSISAVKNAPNKTKLSSSKDDTSVTVKMECDDDNVGAETADDDAENDDVHTPKKEKTGSFPWKSRQFYGGKLAHMNRVCRQCKAPCNPRRRITVISRSIDLLAAGKYRKGLKLMVKSSRGARRALIYVAGCIAAQESQSVCNNDNLVDGLSDDLSIENIKKFDWEKSKKDLETKMPLTATVMCAVMMRKFSQSPEPPLILHLNRNYHRRRCAQLVMAFCILQHAIENKGIIRGQGCKSYTFIRNLVTFIMLMRETNYRVMNFLGYFGACSSRKKKSRLPIEEFLSEPSGRLCVTLAELEVTAFPAFNSALCPREMKKRTPIPPSASYSFCFESIELITSNPRISVLGLQKFVAMPIAVLHRITTDSAEPEYQKRRKSGNPAESLPATAFLPTQQDYTDLRHYMVEVVKMVLVEHIPCLHSLKHLLAKEHSRKSSIRHHEKSREMSQESEFLHMNTIQRRPDDAENTAVDSVLKELHSLMPSDGIRRMPVMVHSDTDMLDSMVEATDVEEVTDDMIGRENLLPVGSEYSKEISMMQDFMDNFIVPERDYVSKNKSKSSLYVHDMQGTLHHIKDLFFPLLHINPARTCFKYCWSLLKLTTEGLTLLLAMKYAGMSSLDSVPADLPDNKPMRLLWLTALARNIVDRVWKQPSNEELHKAYDACEVDEQKLAEEAPYRYCCGNDLGGPMLRCYNINCTKVYIHKDCVTHNEASTESDWYCSKECEDSTNYIYCSCRRWKQEDMVQCQRKTACRRSEWYHFSCADPLATSAEDFSNDWYCSEECMLDEQDDDGVLEYSMTLLWRGLNLLTRRDIVREGNGPMMLQMWKVDMLCLWENNHDKLLKLGHRLLAYTGGFMPKYVANDITWNRVANPTGKSGENFSLEHVTEAKASCVKEALKNFEKCPKTYLEYSCLLGCAAQDIHCDLQRIFNPADSELRGYVDLLKDDTIPLTEYTAHIATFIQEYRDEALLDYCPPREHSALPDIKHRTELKDPSGLGSTLRALSEKLDSTTDKYQWVQREKLREQQSRQAENKAETTEKTVSTSPVPGPSAVPMSTTAIVETGARKATPKTVLPTRRSTRIRKPTAKKEMMESSTEAAHPGTSLLDNSTRESRSMDSELVTMESLDGVQLFQTDDTGLELE